MKLLIIISIILLSIVKSYGQVKEIDINEFTELSVKNNIEIKNTITEKDKSVLELSSAKLLPNPVISFSTEQLKYNDIKHSEYQAELSYPLNFIWEKKSKIEARESIIEYLEKKAEDKIREVSYDARVKYAEHYFLRNLYSSHISTLSDIERLEENAENRFSGGDISEYERNRIIAEVLMLKNEIKNTEKQILANTKELKLLSGISEDTIITDMAIGKMIVPVDTSGLYGEALENRPDYLSLFKLEENEKSAITLNKMKSIPALDIVMGYKYQSDKMKGLILGLDFSVPLFNRNRYDEQINRININRINMEKEFLKNKIQIEINENIKKLRNLSEQLNEIGKANASLILNTSIYSYNKGEIGIAELIDGIKVYIELTKQKLEIENEYIKTFLTLEKITGKKLI